MLIELTEATLISAVSVLASGLVAWGTIRAEVKALRREIDKVQADFGRIQERIDALLTLRKE